jgi:hypothetical protein
MSGIIYVCMYDLQQAQTSNKHRTHEVAVCNCSSLHPTDVWCVLCSGADFIVKLTHQ